MSNPLFSIPGMGGFLAKKQMNEQADMAELQKIAAVMGLMSTQAQLGKMERDDLIAQQRQRFLAGLMSDARPQPLGPQALAEGAQQGDIGPTVTNAARLTAMEQNPTARDYTPVPLGKLSQAAAAGVNIEPFLKLNAEARPDVMQVDAGNEIILRDKKTMRELGRVPKGAAPGSRPYEAQDQTPAQHREFLTGKASAGASRNVTNVNAYTPASEEAQRDFIKSTRTTYDQLKHAPVALESIDKAKALIPGASGFMGPGGEPLLEAAKFLNNRLGMSIATEGVSSAEELRTRIFFNIMDNLKKMDAQPSELQQRIMSDALGKLGTDPNALPNVLDAFGDVIRGKVDLHNREVRGAVERGVKFPYDPVINLPQRGTGASDRPSPVMDQMPPASQHRGRVIEDSSGKRFRSDGMTWRPL